MLKGLRLCFIFSFSLFLSGCANYLDEQFSQGTLIANQDVIYIFRVLDNKSNKPFDVIEAVPGFLYNNGKVEQDQLRVGPPQFLKAQNGYFIFRSTKSFESDDVIIVSGLRTSDVQRPGYGYCASKKVFAINRIKSGVSYLGDVLIDFKQGGFSYTTSRDEASLLKFLETNFPNIPTQKIENEELGLFEVDQTCSRVITIY
jgi:hypothetical protein